MARKVGLTGDFMGMCVASVCVFILIFGPLGFFSSGVDQTVFSGREGSCSHRGGVVMDDSLSDDLSVSVCSPGTDDLVPPWDIYGWDQSVQVWGGHVEWGAKAGNITTCDLTAERGYGHVESRAFGTKCLVTLWFGHFTQWVCPKTGVYNLTFYYSYFDGVSNAYYTIHPEFSGELQTRASVIFFPGFNASETLIFSRSGKHTNQGFQGNMSQGFQMTCLQGNSYTLGANLSLLAYTDSWDEAWSSSQIEASGMLTKIIIDRVNTPPGKPSRPVGPGRGIIGREYLYSATGEDFDGDDLYYFFDWGDGTSSGWRGPYPPGVPGNASHIYHEGNYSIQVKVKDEMGKESPWSDPLPVVMPMDSAPLGNWAVRLGKQCFLVFVTWIQRLLYPL